MDVTIRKQSMVPPAEPTPTRVLWNSSLDLIANGIHVQSVYFFQNNDNSADFFNHEKLAEGLGRTLVPFYPIAGRLKLGEGGRRIEIDCNAEGALLVEAQTSAAIADLGEFAPGPRLRQLVPPVDYSQDLASYPLLVIQVTFFECGGVSVGIGQHHYVADGVSGVQCINTWSEMARGVPPKVHPVIDRSLLKANTPPVPKFAHIEYNAPPTLRKRDDAVGTGVGNGNGAVKGSSYNMNGNGHGRRGTNGRHDRENGNGHSTVENGIHHHGNGNGNGVPKLTKEMHNVKLEEDDIPMEVRVFKFTRQQLDTLKQMAVDAKTDVTFSSYEMLSGHIWKCVTQARNLEPSQETKLFVATDGRSRLVPPLPKGYLGNEVFFYTPISTAGELVRNPVTCGAQKIHDALANMNDEYLRSLVDYLEGQEDVSQLCLRARHFTSPNLCITSWARMPLYECDFGWGRPVFIGPSTVAYEGKAYVLPSSSSERQLDPLLGLESRSHGRFLATRHQHLTPERSVLKTRYSLN